MLRRGIIAWVDLQLGGGAAEETPKSKAEAGVLAAVGPFGVAVIISAP
jgi:hypothetical protein